MKWICPVTNIELNFRSSGGFIITFNKRILTKFKSLDDYIEKYLNDPVIQKCYCCENIISVYRKLYFNTKKVRTRDFERLQSLQM